MELLSVCLSVWNFNRRDCCIRKERVLAIQVTPLLSARLCGIERTVRNLCTKSKVRLHSHSTTVLLCINPLNAELNPIRHLLALVGAHHIVHVSRIRVYENIHSTLLYVSAIFCYREACFTQRDEPQCGAQFVILRKQRLVTAKTMPDIVAALYSGCLEWNEGFSRKKFVNHYHTTRRHIPEANNLKIYSKALRMWN